MTAPGRESGTGRRLGPVLGGTVCAGVICLSAIWYCINADTPWNLPAWGKLAGSERISFKDAIRIGSWFAAVAVAVLGFLGALTSPLWARSGVLHADSRFPSPSFPRWLPLALLLPMILAGVLRWTFAHNSLWWDEIWTLRYAVLGERTLAEDGIITHEPVDWSRTFYYYNKPTNHVPFSVASKLCLHLWQKAAGKAAWEFDEFVFRLPNFLWAIASVACIAWLLCEWGQARAGVLAAFFLALHPWHVRYGIDGRGFCLVFLSSLLACIALTRSLRRGSLLAFLAFGASLALLLWAFPYAIYLAITLGATGLVVILTSTAETRGIRLWRYLAGLAFGAVLFLPLVGPLVPQMMGWTDVKGNNMIDGVFLQELWAAFTSGIPFSVPSGLGSDGLPSLTGMMGGGVVVPILFVMVPILCGLGLFVLLRRALGPGFVLLALILAVPFALGTAYVGTHYFYTRYVVYGLAATLCALSLGLCALGDGVARRWGAPRSAVPAVALCLFVVLAFGQLDVLRTRPYAPMRQVAEYLADLRDSEGGAIVALGFNLGGDTPSVYNPHVVYFEKVEELIQYTREANADNETLYVFYGYDSFNRHDEPPPFELLDDRALFEVVKTFDGIEPQFHYQILRYTRKPLPQS